MKKVILSATIAVSASSMAFALLPFGEGNELFVTGTGIVRYDDNITSNSTKTDDTIFELDPGIQVTTGKNAQIKTTLAYIEAITRYVSHNELNTDLARVSLDSNYFNNKSKVALSLGYNEFNQNTPGQGVAGLLRRDATSMSLTGETDLSQKTSIGAGFTYDKSHYPNQNLGAVDSKIYSVPVNLYYAYDPKVSLSVGLRYRKTTQQGLPSYEDYYYSVGARGEFSPKLIGEFGVGLNQRKTANASTELSPGLNSALTYIYSEKTSLKFSINNDFSNSSAGASQQTFSATAGLATNLAVNWTGNANVTFENTDYKIVNDPRTDKYYEFSMGATYQITQTFSMSGSYTHRDNASTKPNLSFTDNVFAVSAVVRF